MRFLFCDRILELQPGKHVISVRTVTIGDEFLTDHYSRRAMMPATLMLEGLAQAAGWLYLATENFGINVLLALVQDVEVLRHAGPGDTLLFEVWMEYCHRDGATMRGAVHIGQETALRVRRLMFASEKSQPEDAAKAREVFAYVSGGCCVLEKGGQP